MNNERKIDSWSGEQDSSTAANPAAGTATEAAGMKAVEHALEQSPVLHIPADFAARVAAQAVTQPGLQRVPGSAYPASFGPRLAVASGLLLTGALFALAPHATPSFANLRFDLELLLLTEVGGIGFLLTRVQSRE